MCIRTSIAMCSSPVAAWPVWLPPWRQGAVAARIHAELRDLRERVGQPLPFVDGQIAAIAIACGATLVTRNTRDFEGLAGLRLADWFSAA